MKHPCRELPTYQTGNRVQAVKRHQSTVPNDPAVSLEHQYVPAVLVMMLFIRGKSLFPATFKLKKQYAAEDDKE
jgi:hypothetical protein